MRENPSRASSWLTARPIAHRGLHDAKQGVIENARTAFARALDHGFAIECDVQLTKDGEAVVFHDDTLDRLTGESGLVSARTAAELDNIGISGSKDGDTINSLSALLDQVAARVPVIVEIKSRFDGDLRLTRRVAEVLHGRNVPVAVKSFDPRIVAALRMMLPDRPRGIVAMAQYDYPDYAEVPPDEKRAMAHLLHYSETQPDFISWHVKDLPHAGPHLCRAALGLPVMTWTVRTPEDVTRASRYADQIVFEGFVPD
jgi:glycerophosphoryl diester phosphodiesterase